MIDKEQTTSIENAKALQNLIECAARQFNRHVAEAANLGMNIDANLVDVRFLGIEGPTPFLDVRVAIRPDRITLSSTRARG